MKLSIAGFTEGGSLLCARLCASFLQEGWDCKGYVPQRFFRPEWRADGVAQQDRSLAEWTGFAFAEGRNLVFVGAAGIAVRAVAPYVKDKMEDPAVIVVDEAGRFAVPLLSGHVGGANELAERIAAAIGALPVITTATDVRGIFAVDVFAVKNNLAVTDRRLAKEVSASLLEGKPVGFFSDFPFKDREKGCWTPKGCVDRECEINIRITTENGRFEKPCLLLVPRCIILGVGCRRGTDENTLEREIESALRDGNIHPGAVKALATIDVKADEACLLALTERRDWELKCYSAGALGAVEGTFEESEFVKKTVGVGNVCERACTAEGGRLVLHKRTGGGVALAAAQEQVKLKALDRP